MHVTIRSVAGHAAATVPPADELVLGKLACQAGFVISFYDLSSPIPGPSVHCCTDEAPTGSRPLDGQPIDKTEGGLARYLRVRPRRIRKGGRAESLLKG